MATEPRTSISLPLPSRDHLPGVGYREILATYAAHDDRGLLLVGTERRVLAMNEKARTLLDYAEPLPRALPDVVRDADFAYAVGDSLHDLRDVWHETYAPHPDRLLRVHVIPVLGEDRIPVLAIVTVEDITRLRHLETVRRDFVANVSHELRTPLASISLLVETLQNGAMEDPEASAHFLRRIQIETQAMAHMVEELLELSRLETGTLSLDRREMEVKTLLESVCSRMIPIAEERRVTVRLDTQEGLPAVRADPDRIEQVLMNLTHNALKYSPPGATVTLRARRQGRGVQIEVIDTGPGLTEAEVGRVFERFYKVDKGRNRNGGAGLGLAISRHLVELHGSRLQVISEPGHGSRFFFALPIAN